MPRDSGAPITTLSASAYTVPTATPESDGTLQWDATTLVLVEATAGPAVGVGFSYTTPMAAGLIDDVLAEAVLGVDAFDVPATWEKMRHAIRNLGRPGVASSAIAAVDHALWDLKARLLDVPLCILLGRQRPSVPVYGSGGFTSYSLDELCEQLSGWAEDGFTKVKMKVGRDPRADVGRVRAARKAIGDDVDLFVDANGAYSVKQALAMAEAFAEEGVVWFEEPVSSDDLEGLAQVRRRAPAGMDITAGEYGYDLFYFASMLEAGAVDVVQADATRCGGTSEFLRVGALCEAAGRPMSAHCAPLAHLHPACSLHRMVHLEYFFDHVRIEDLLFDGAPAPHNGELSPDLSRPGVGWQLKPADAERYRVR